jgi:hypothetical protein
LGREPKVGDQVERFTNTHFAVPRLGLSKILFSLLRNLRNVGSKIYGNGYLDVLVLLLTDDALFDLFQVAYFFDFD